MKKIKFDKNSLRSKLVIFVIVLIVAQSTLLIGTMIVAGVVSEAEQTAFQSFHEKVDKQKEYIQREMNNRWTNVDPYLKELSKLLPTIESEETINQFFEKSVPTLISMLRSTKTNGTFIILDEKLENKNEHLALYFRDYDPYLNDDKNKDLYMISGPFEIAQKLNIPMDQSWSYNFNLTEQNKNFYEIPYNMASLSAKSTLLGYWSTPFTLTSNDLPIITYSMPLFDQYNKLRGIVGVEIQVDYFIRFLPASDLRYKDSLGYMIGYNGIDENGIRPLITTGAMQERMIRTNEVLTLTNKDDQRSIYLLENHNSFNDIYASVQKMNLYSHHTPFEQEEWFLIGFVADNNLLSFVNKIKNILFISFISSIIIGIVGSYFISLIVTIPILNLAKQVGKKYVDQAKRKLTKTGVTEIDELASAIEIANDNLYESTTKLSKIINLVNVPIAAFEFKQNNETVFVTDQLKQVLSLEENEGEELSLNKSEFIQRLTKIMDKQEPEEENVYKISNSPEKWVRINLAVDEMSTLGIIIEVTEEIKEKNQIKLDRDHDMMTKIYNRGAFERNVTRLLEDTRLGVAAFIMLDLDYLKQVNDTYGHKCGDVYIMTTAKYLSLFEEKGGIIGRLSGDEFAVFLYGFSSMEEIRDLVNQFYQKLKTHLIHFPGGDMYITISAGLYWLIDQEMLTYDEISQKADEALYHAKNKAKGSCYEFESE